MQWFGVVRGHWRVPRSSCSKPPIVTEPRTCTMLRYRWKNTNLTCPTAFGNPAGGDRVRIHQDLRHQKKTESLGYCSTTLLVRYCVLAIFVQHWLVTDRQAERWKDGQTDGYSTYHSSIVSRGNNLMIAGNRSPMINISKVKADTGRKSQTFTDCTYTWHSCWRCDPIWISPRSFVWRKQSPWVTNQQ